MKAMLEQLMEEDEFIIFQPGVEIIEKAGEDPEQTRPIGGHCSTENLDRQEEVVVAKGLDFTEFVSFGYFNDNHKQDTSAVLGYPKMARLENGTRWWTEGNLLVGYPPADRIWELAKSLKKSRAPRSLGFSIEGKVVQRDSGNRIMRAKVRNVAITNCPVNTDCSWSIMAKAFAPSDVVDRAAKKALAVQHSPLLREALDARTLVREDNLDYEEAVARVQALRPHLSKAMCERIVSFAFKQW
jgi:hypothetical protein